MNGERFIPAHYKNTTVLQYSVQEQSWSTSSFLIGPFKKRFQSRHQRGFEGDPRDRVLNPSEEGILLWLDKADECITLVSLVESGMGSVSTGVNLPM